MLQEISHNGAHRDIITDSRNPHLQTADTPHDQIDLHPGGACSIQSRNNIPVAERIHFRHDPGLPSFQRVFPLHLNLMQETVTHPDRRHYQFIPRPRFRIA